MKPKQGFVVFARTFPIFLLSILTGCGGGGGGDHSSPQATPPASVTETSGSTSTVTNTASTPGAVPASVETFDPEVFFNTNIEPNLSICRVCHIPGGVADTDKGKRFMLSKNTAEDYANVKSGWKSMGGGVESNLILVNNSDATAGHTGGQNWPVGSAAYKNMAILFKCWANPASCAPQTTTPTSSGNTSASSLPLLEIGQKKSPLTAGCEGKPDSEPLPLDPRRLVVDGVNKPGVAVQFNGYWIDTHEPLPPFKKNKYQRAKTCGEWRNQVAIGENYIAHESIFLGGMRLFTANIYRNLWKNWGVKQRPENYEEEVMKRYGLTAAPFRNPYPLEGEDPNLTDGGSGQLPLGLVLIKHPVTHKYTGEITISCSSCHDSQLGPEFKWGRGSSSFDIGLWMNDIAKTTIGIPAVVPFPAGTNVGVSNALGVIDVVSVIFDTETLDIIPGVEFFPAHGSEGQVKAPNWWTRAFATRLWHGGISGDNVRSALALEVPNLYQNGAQRRETEGVFEDVHAFFNSLAPPAYPYPEKIDQPLAEAGAVLFHTKNLWANGANSQIPKQPGNGSCASCHGVYSPRYAADPTMLPDPRLKAIAGVITPWETIGTDPERLHVMSKGMRRAWNTSWFGYDDLNPDWTPEGQGRPGTSLERLKNDEAATNTRLLGPSVWSEIEGYSAPPLYGVWAAAPYFHNGSIPTIWAVLKPSDRPDIWQPPLVLATPPAVNDAIDTSFAGYDFDRLGFKFTQIPCEPGTERFSCNPTNPLDAFLSVLAKTFGSNTWLAYQSMPPLTQKDLEARKITNTHEFSRGNQGHEFTEVLTDQERYAIIEYLKTL